VINVREAPNPKRRGMTYNSSQVLNAVLTLAKVSSGSAPIAPLKADACSVVSLATRTVEAILRPVCRHRGWVGSIRMEYRQAGLPATEVMNATRKSPGVSHAASTAHGRRFPASSEVNGNAAMAISPGLNIAALVAECRIRPPRNNVGIAVEIRFLHQEIERAAGLGDRSHHAACGFVLRQCDNRQPRVRWKGAPLRKTKSTIFFDHDRNQLHASHRTPHQRPRKADYSPD
jgi:hypothetical protein